MATKLTDAAIRRMPVPKNGEPKITWDTMATGFGLKVTPRGKRIFVLQTKYPGHAVQTIRTLGIYPALTLEAARRKAEHWYALARQGIDPKEVEAEARAEAEAVRQAKASRRANTFSSVAERYIAGRTNRRARMDEREIRRTLIAAWGDLPITDIAPRDVRHLIEGIMARGAPYEAKNAWTHAVGVLKFAVHQELIDASPCASLDRRLLFKGARIEPRQRVLGDDEVFALWRASGRLGYPAGPIYRLLLLTGCRVSEVAGARWSELHPELRRVVRKGAQAGEPVDWSAVPAAHKTWTVPRERFKSAVVHAVPLTDDACREIGGLPQFAACDFFFTTTGKVAVWLSSKIKAELDARMQRTLRALARRRGDDPSQVRLERWVTHDLRRVVRTNLAALDVADHVAEMVLGHGRRGLQRVYDQHRYEPQMRDALERWAGRLRAVTEPAPAQTEPAKVVPFAAKRKAGAVSG